MLTPGYSAPTGAVRRVFRADRFAIAGACLGYGEMKGRISIEKRFDMLEARAGGETRFGIRLKVEKILAAETARGTSHVHAEIAPRVFDGVLSGRSTVSGALLVRKNLRTWPAGESSAAATPLIEKILGAQAHGAPRFDIRLKVEKILGVEPVLGSSSASALPLIEKLLVTRATGHADAAATVRVEKLLGALPDGSAHVVATLLTLKQLSGSVSALGASTGALTVEKQLSAAASGESLMLGEERIWKRLEASTSGIAIVSATMEPPVTYRRTQSDDIRETQSGDVRQTERDVN